MSGIQTSHQNRITTIMKYARCVPMIMSLMIVSPATLPIDDASAAACPNEAQRAALHSVTLPDCRAYELVSPTTKYGQLVEVSSVSTDGARVTARSLGAFAGSNQTSLFNIYEFARGLGGWEVAPVNLPAGYVNASAATEVLLAASPDLGQGLFEYQLLSTADPRDIGFYIKSLPAGPLVRVGPHVSPSALASNSVAGGVPSSEPSISRDFSHVLFMLKGPYTDNGEMVSYLWPKDTTVLNAANSGNGFVSLYEYAGTGNSAPSLVGVDNAGELISQCGISLGYPEEGIFTTLQGYDYYNAISADGSRVFFTAAAKCSGGEGPPVNELFARVNQEETVAVSEPSYPLAQGSGSGPEECDASCAAKTPGELREGVFQGASDDGSKVFFLTAQSLLNGDKDTGTDLYEAEIVGKGANAKLGRLVQVSHDPTAGQAAEAQGVGRISEDGSHVYFVARGVLTEGPNREGGKPTAGEDNLYAYDTETRQMAFVGTLSAGDSRDWQLRDSRPVDATPDGRSLVFVSRTDLTAEETGGTPQVFEYDAQAQTLVRVSRPQNGLKGGQGGEFETTIRETTYTANSNPDPTPSSISDNGAYVAFQSTAGLTSQAAVGYNNVYEYHAGQLSLISDGQDHSTPQLGGESSTGLIGIDGSGTDLFFTTADQLIPQDGNTFVDVYDARIDGGFAPPAGLAPCEGDGCQGALSASPVFSAPSSADLTGSGHLAPPPPATVAPKTVKCSRGKKLSHGKCVKAKSRKKTKSKKAKFHKGGR